MQRIIIFICREFASFRRSDPDFRSTGPNTAFGDACKRIHRYYDSGPDRVHPAGDCAGPAEGPHQRRPLVLQPVSVQGGMVDVWFGLSDQVVVSGRKVDARQ